MDHQEMLKRALNARVADLLPTPTPLDLAPLLSARLKVAVFLKREDLTPIFSFKLRGAYNRVALLDAEQKSRGRDRGVSRKPRAGRGPMRPRSWGCARAS